MIPLVLTYKLIQESVTSVDVARGNFHIHYGHVGWLSLQVPKRKIRLQPPRLLLACTIKIRTLKWNTLNLEFLVHPLLSIEGNSLIFSCIFASRKRSLVRYLILMKSSSVAPRGVSSFWVASSSEKALASEQQLQPWYSNVLCRVCWSMERKYFSSSHI